MKWTKEKAQDWYKSKNWLCGFNFLPSSAVNTTEFWQRETFDPETIDRELSWAGEIGFNTCRVFMQYLVWEADSDGLLERMDQFLEIADRHNISTMFCLFDDCAFSGKQPYLGKQDDPVAGIHNSGWTPSPGHERVVDQAYWTQLEKYVTGVVSRFAGDSRVVAWDIYNEPGNSSMGDKSLPLLREAFLWTRNTDPEQPLTAGVWSGDLKNLSEATLELSDVITFHNYGKLESLEAQIAHLKSLERPVICTEWMSRTLGSFFQTHLPVFKRENAGCYSWGLVKGKTQTCFPWGSPEGAPEPELWFHDIFHPDGRPYSPEEIKAIRKYTRP